jgi:hypothetical protein
MNSSTPAAEFSVCAHVEEQAAGIHHSPRRIACGHDPEGFGTAVIPSVISDVPSQAQRAR